MSMTIVTYTCNGVLYKPTQWATYKLEAYNAYNGYNGHGPGGNWNQTVGT